MAKCEEGKGGSVVSARAEGKGLLLLCPIAPQLQIQSSPDRCSKLLLLFLI